MRFPADMTVRPGRIWFIALLAGAAFAAFAAPSAQAAPEFGVEKFVAANCSVGFEECGSETVLTPPFPFKYSVPKEPTLAEAKEQGYTQAAGHPPYGITDFKVNTVGALPNEVPVGIAEGKVVTHIRTDVGPGVSTNPEAVAKCSMKEFDGNAKEAEAVPGSGLYAEPECSEAGSENTVIGVNKVTIYAGPGGVSKTPEASDLPLEGVVYNLVQPQGLASDFGVALKLPMAVSGAALKKGFEEAEAKGAKPGVGGFPSLPEQKFLEEQQYYAHTLIEGSVEWASDYHDYYEINVSPKLPLIASRLVLFGNIGNTENGGFITNPSNCAGPGPATTNTVTLEPTIGAAAALKYTTPIGTEGCTGVSPFSPVPFEPTFSLKTETAQSDQPTGVTTELKLPHAAGPKEIDSSQLDNAIITLPEGMTLNPSAAHGLQACTPAQIGMGTRNPAKCPYGSKIGTATVNVPDLPPESLKGSIYLGGSESGLVTGQPYIVYVNAESARFGVTVRLKGMVEANETTGRVTAKFLKNPEQPFSEVILHFKDGPLAPIANPLACGTATTTTELVPYIGAFATKTPSRAFTVDSDGSSGTCASPLPFALTQSSSSQPATGGASTNFTFNLTRPSGQQYLSQIKTVLPAGLVGRIPAVALCTEAQVAEARAGTGGCPALSRIGSVAVLAGAGPAPYQFNGSAYLTGPYGGAPYGMAIVVPAVAGPFSLGNVVTQETINVEPYTSRVVVAGSVPTIFKGIPLRIQSLNVEVNRQGFMLNPTSCAALSTESMLTGITLLGSSTTTTQNVASPFTTEECSKLAFKPSLTAIAGGKPTRTNGANIEVNISQGAGQANIKQVMTMLPKQLPVRLSTLSKACPAATFEAGAAPGGCSKEANVGTVKATTPALPGTLTGPAYLVSHGGEAYPNLDLILQGDGVTVILVGHTKVSNSIITTTFESLPDVPISSFSLYLPSAPNSVLAANGNLCTSNLVMPTTIVGQNGVKITQNTKISVRNCPVQIVKHRTAGTTATLTVQTPAAGSISASGTDLKFTKRNVGKAERTTLKVSLTRMGAEVLRKFRQLRIKVRVGFVPKQKGATSKAFATVTFRA
ncbi:MAG TPA: hypothetical protein VNY52_13270 [Solirubrobacteraceae bacterium]|jgi:hypothetical protein|nr:hypothetical protein [Solirubrobacteraceae bacterium]